MNNKITHKEKLILFKNELKSIKNKEIRTFTCKVLLGLPDYFFTIAASSTGKYHPKFSLGKGGLVRHVKAAVKIAQQLFTNECLTNFSELEQDIIISVLILHDGIKHGTNGSKYTVPQHPNLIADFVNTKPFTSIVEESVIKRITSALKSHMGPWNLNKNKTKELFPKPKTKIERFVHLCDYLSSRRFINVDLED